MDWDRLPAARRIAKRDRLLVRYLREEVHPFSTTEARRLDGAGLVGGKLRSADDLGRLAPVDPAAVDGLDSMLRPTAAGLSASPDRFRWWWATVTGRRATFVDEEIDPRFRPIHFDDHGDLVVASSAADLDRLTDLGRRALGLAGVRRDDAVVTLLPARGDLAFWTVTLGCRRSGVAAIHLGEAAPGRDVAGYAPSVLVGTAASVRRVAAEDPEVAATVALVLVAERLSGDDRVDLADRYPGASVRALWSPPGVRAPWVECAAGRLHTWPDAEVVQTVDGEVVWTPLGWRGTVVLRLRTGIRARVVDEPCACGATSPRLEVLDVPDAAEEVSDDGRAGIAALAAQRGGRRNRSADHGVMADDALADAFFADDPATALASYADAESPHSPDDDIDAKTPAEADADADGDADADETDADADDADADADADDADAEDADAVTYADDTADAEVGAADDVDAVTYADGAGPDALAGGGTQDLVAVPAPGPGPAGPGPGRADRRALAADEARLASVLDREKRVGAWIAEVETDGSGRGDLVVRLAPVVGERAALEAELPRLGEALGASRVVVERPSIVRQRLEAAGGARVVATVATETG